MNETLLPPIAGIRAGEPGCVDRQLSALADRLELSGLVLSGAVQEDIQRSERCRCDMTIRILDTDLIYPISSDLGPMSRGCRLDSGALEQAAWEVELMLRSASLQARPQLLIINKFSKREAQGKGFLPAMLLALELGIPVLCGIGRLSLDDFIAFADGHAELLEPGISAMDQWVANCLPAAKTRRTVQPGFSPANLSPVRTMV